ncbi:long-chain acyl-CoA synthetase [Serratia sp. CC22-02]|uniref:AMP-binding protein n=1 Tax=Serratia sp. CC22-02 TaxID=1378076 RepID=UPI00240309DA|nr:AMP-binding protein [Serratia sp. CC22-02]SMP82412.1 long-chain acyl-CoA synthetase [Serratia sp. CC22-02]
MERHFQCKFPVGIPANIEPLEYETLPLFFEDCFRRFSDESALSCGENTLTYRQLDQLSRRFAAFLQQSDYIIKGDRLAIMLPNSWQYVIALIGALRAGLVVVNLNPHFTPREIFHHLSDSQAVGIVTLNKYHELLSGDQKLPEGFFSIYTHEEDRAAITSSHDTKTINNKIGIDFISALSSESPEQYHSQEVHGNDIAFLQYTGGTTGMAKGAMLSHRNLVANVAQAQAMFNPLLRIGEEKIITALPLYHIFALTVNLLFFMSMGAKNLLITDPQNIAGLLRNMEEEKFSAISGVNTLYRILLQNEKFKSIDFSNLRFCVSAGMPLTPEVAQAWLDITKQPIWIGYGLTETSPLVSVQPYTTKEYYPHAGMPAPSTEIRMVDELGKDVPTGEQGELLVKGPQVMLGYWNNPIETAAALKDGWLFTGDIARCDEQGYIHIVGRKKEMILVSGFNVYPAEIEAVVSVHPKVREAAVIGIPDENSGEAVKLFIVKKDDSLTSDEIKEHCRRLLTGYKNPKWVVFIDSLPKSAVGKVLRNKLREDLQ